MKLRLISLCQYLDLLCTLLKFRFHHVPITLVINIHIVVKVVFGQFLLPVSQQSSFQYLPMYTFEIQIPSPSRSNHSRHRYRHLLS